MSQADSIFSNPTNSNGESPNNPFASLASESKQQSPFAPVSNPASPFGFEEERPRIPEKRSQSQEPQQRAENPFQAAPHVERQPVESVMERSPFAPSQGFEAPSSTLKPMEEAPKITPINRPQMAEAQEAPVHSPFENVAMQAPAMSVQHQPQPQPQAQPMTSASPLAPITATAQAPQAATPSYSPPSANGRHSTRQLELRAIFGVENEMSREEILKRSKNLPGIRDLAVVGSGEMSALQTIGDVMSRFGYGDSGSWQMTCPGGVVDFVSSDRVTLAVLREGRYSAGVWETLMIVARELGNLS